MDGGLRKLFQKNLPQFHFVSIETGSTGRGIPDSNYCLDGHEGWIEFKTCTANAVGMRPEQIAWIERRRRAGGRVWIMVRKHRPVSPRLAACDELWMFHGADVRALAQEGLACGLIYAHWEGGPARWAWENIGKVLLEQP